jgi:hypothetical protein
VSDAAPGVRADINYVRNRAAAGATLEFVPHAPDRTTMVTRPGEPMWIADARGLATDLDREGFVLVPHVSTVADFDAIESDPEVDRRYAVEMTDLLRAVSGASRVLMLSGAKKRYGESAVDKLAGLTNAEPARYPHADYTDASSEGMARMVLRHLGSAPGRRWALYNLWRACTPPPQDFPLAVCDARTVGPDDEVVVTALTIEQGDRHVRHDTTGFRHNPAHRWHYYRDMTRDEVLVFKGRDSDPARAGRVPHSAFTDPTCPPGVPTRASVEIRGLAVFD